MSDQIEDTKVKNIAGDTAKLIFDDETKAFLSKELGIIVDGELFDPRYDYVFKRIFTADSEKSKYALIDFLNAVLRFSEEQKIVDLTVINAEIPVDEKGQKKSVFDIRVIFKNGEQAIVEMEFRPKDDFKKRSQFLISKAYISQKISGMMFRDLKKCYLVCVTNFTLFDGNSKFYRDFMYRDESGVPLTDDLTIVFLELSKIEALLNKPVEELSNIDMWAIFLRYASDKDKRDILNKILNKEEGIKMAAQVLETISKDERERMIYESQLLFEADQAAELSYVKRTSREEGRADVKIEAAKEMLKNNEPVEKIIRYLRLDESTIIRLKSEL